MRPQEPSALENAFAEVCAQVQVAQGPAALAQALQRVAPQYDFREALVRGGWYRLGGVIDAAGRRLSDNLEHWAEEALAMHGGDLEALVAACTASGLYATRFIGKTHYWVARTGPQPPEFIQVEIEELQEIIAHPLFTADQVPTTLEELIDPRAIPEDRAEAIGLPFYRLRRLTDIAELLENIRLQYPEPQAIHRFVEDWGRSSAGHHAVFSNHWVLGIRTHLDCYHQWRQEATPIPALNRAPPRFEIEFGARGLVLAEALRQFDRQLGYPMAWFFDLLARRGALGSSKQVHHAVATAIMEDFQEGFSYLPERDVQVVRDWLHRPYGF